MTESERALLFAIRSTVDALLMAGGEPERGPEPCAHEQREPAPDSTLGRPRWRCARCLQPVEG